MEEAAAIGDAVWGARLSPWMAAGDSDLTECEHVTTIANWVADF
jgi:hypothetical protein